MMNNVNLIGRLTKDVDLRYTASGVAVANFNLAVQRKYVNQNNERETDFINCIIWRKSAEALAEYTRKGSLIGIEGHLQTRNYENQQGQKVYVTEVVADNFQLLESKEITENRKKAAYSSYQNNHQQDQPEPVEFSDDDLPF